MEVASELLGKVRQAERGAIASTATDEVGELVELTRKGKLGRVGQQRVIDVLANSLLGDGFMPISAACSAVTSAARRRMEHTRA